MTIRNMMQSMLPIQESNDFSTTNWLYRRTIIIVSMIVCGICIICVTLVVVGAIGLTAWTGRAVTYDSNLLRLAESLLWGAFTSASAIIGAYVFGANFDTKDYRKSIIELQSRGVTTISETKVTTSIAEPQSDASKESDEVKANQTSGTSTKGEPAG